MLYARQLTLRNCGRFTVIASDFGADYRTFTHVSSEALYASLTRGATWKPRLVVLKNDPLSFLHSYDVAALPLWFVPALFEADGDEKDALRLDTTQWNVLHEWYPSTSTMYDLQDGEVRERGMMQHVPSHGTIEAITPDHRLVTFGFSGDPRWLAPFECGQTYMMGKKRTMFQIMALGPVLEGVSKQGVCSTSWLELPSSHVSRFQQFEIASASIRYLLIRGTTRAEEAYIEFEGASESLRLPYFYLDQLPLRFF